MITPPLDFLDEPAFVLGPDGTILSANIAARRMLAGDVVGRVITDFVEDDAVTAYLRRASGSTAPLPGGLTLRAAAGPQRSRVHAARLSRETPLIVLRCHPGNEDRFDVLSRRVQDLDAQLRLRLREKEALEKALAENRTLLQELQHRVRNTIQMMMTLLKLSARGRSTPEIVEIVGMAELRLHAMAASHEAVTRAVGDHVAVAPMLRDLLRTAYGGCDGVDMELAGGAGLVLGSAHCLALVFVEFIGVTRPESGLQNFRIRFGIDGSRGHLSVERPSEGGGPDAALLRSLARQMGAVLEQSPQPGGMIAYGIDFPLMVLREAA